MKLLRLLLILSTVVFQGCHFSLGEIQENQLIDKALKQQIHELNDKLFKAEKIHNSTLLKQIMSPKAIEEGSNYLDKLASKIDSFPWGNSYSVVSEYYIKRSGTGNLHLPVNISGDRAFMINYVPMNKEGYVALLFCKYVYL